MKRITKILDTIIEDNFFKKGSRYLLILLFLYYFSGSINNIIVKYFTIKEEILTNIHGVFVSILFLISFIYIVYVFLLKKYQPSNLFKDTLSIVTLFSFLIRCTNDGKEWAFISFKNNFYFIDFFFILSSIILIYFMISYFSKEKEEDMTDVPFLSDEPILLEDEDNLDYKTRANEIFKYIKRLNFTRSFTIGIVGPRGNGKSSLIRLIRNKIKEDEGKDLIEFKFLPYLNHNEKDIISEFFNQLSTEISKYNGELSNEFLNYSERLLKLYNSKNIIDFLKPKTTTNITKPSYEIYEKINKVLGKLNKKCIIFIDDLDRLSSKEILQVLKLVRNSANFKNFIFFIAIDKDYVLETLTKNKDIINHKFLDKFFQLEIYLPEIDKEQLKTAFIKYVKKSDLRNETTFIFDIEKAIYLKTNLFEDYIRNYRDVKRLVNQLVFDYNMLPDKLNTNDFLNFTYLKMTFPSILKILGENWREIIPYNQDTNLCELLEVEETDNSRGYLDLFSYLNNNLDIVYRKYKISKTIDHSVSVEQNTLTIKQNRLIVKSLIVLFGKENKNETYSSIKFENNFRKLIQQKVLDSDFTEDDFKSIFDDDNFENLKSLLNKKHVNNILDRIAFFNTNEEEKFYKVIDVLLYLFDYSGKDDIPIFKKFINFINRIRNNKVPFLKEDNKTWKYVKKYFIESKDYSLENRINFISLISENRESLEGDDWEVKTGELKKMMLKKYKELLSSRQNVLWKHDDVAIYRAYYYARGLHSAETINRITKDFWAKKDIDILCAQLIQNGFETKILFKTSEYASDLFITKQAYKKYIDKRIDEKPSKRLKEYKEFLQLESLTNFTDSVRFEFKEFKEVNEKLKDKSILKNKFDSIVEVIFKSNSASFSKVTRINTFDIKDVISMRSYKSYEEEEISYTFFKLDPKAHVSKIKLLKHFEKELKEEDIKTTIVSEDIKLKGIEGGEHENEYIELISTQPKLYS